MEHVPMLEYEFPKNINVPLNPRYNSLQVYKERSMHEYVFELRMEVYLRFLIKALEGGKKLCALVFVEIKPLMAIVIEEQDLENDVISRENCEDNSNHGKEKMALKVIILAESKEIITLDSSDDDDDDKLDTRFDWSEDIAQNPTIIVKTEACNSMPKGIAMKGMDVKPRQILPSNAFLKYMVEQAKGSCRRDE
uniref:Predicted protein n=1 Tax=Physcomitrium patens TaxID=3218 RepID=A9TLN4_PHYPA